MKKAALVTVAVVATAFLLRPMRIEGDSMLPTYQAGDIVLTLPAWGAIEQGQVVVFDPPQGFPDLRDPSQALVQHALDPNQSLIKRVIGLPGQAPNPIHTPETKLTGNGTATGGPAVSPATHSRTWGLATQPAAGLPEDHYFLIGDNPSSSLDSRQFGSVPRDRIERRVVARIWSTSP